ncbi:pyridoxamine 5'-phosphate oxidase family protein [Halorussus salilacus]|uniref:pyridoxamine 5'-phosphate oxidase family protein n=1 Tax=Halorussus salilacus TaxID=2953750 RepID=UPI00209D933A|nr:pyridoxamine 5'-phosphate oxidase family protein [Halorussus salilacus]USZ69317.1 pyridoxamine 5'-phosphate oxidase family protein [Halorussus salilacus]
MFADPLDAETPDIEMDADEVNAFLRGQGWGCLTMARDSVAYSIPVSFGYDGDSTFYFQLQTDEGCEKLPYLDATTTATLVVPEVRPPEWTSVMVRGPLEVLTDDGITEALAVIGDNAWFPLAPWSDGQAPTHLSLYALEAEELTGRSSAVGTLTD